MHELFHHLVRRFADADVVAQAFAHATNSVEANKNWRHHADLLIDAGVFLQIASEHEAVKLLGAAEFDVRLNLDRVPGLHHRVQTFVEEDGLLIFVAFGEIVSCQKLGDGDLAAEIQDLGQPHFPEPVAVAVHFCLVEVDDLADLFQVVASVVLDVFFGQLLRTSCVAPAGIADESRRVSNDDDCLMAEFLELTNLSQRDGVPKVDINAGRIDSVFDTQRRARFETLLQLPSQLFFRDDFFDAAADNRELFIDGWELHGGIVDRKLELKLDRARRLPTRRGAFQRRQPASCLLSECCLAAGSLTSLSESSLLLLVRPVPWSCPCEKRR